MSIIAGAKKKYWQGTGSVQSESYVCWFCGNLIATAVGYAAIYSANQPFPAAGVVRICQHCDSPTYFDQNGRRFPAAPPGRSVSAVPKDVNDLYEEARRSAGAEAPTAAVLVCRKILMHIAVEKGAQPGQTFMSYVEHLDAKHYIPPDGKHWVDHIRKRSNDANHDVTQSTAQDAVALIELTEMLLRVIYEFPSKVPRPPP